MSVPRNNLADLLKLKANTQSYTPPPRTRSGPKFKPAVPTPSSAAGTPSGLPSFATPGFKRPKHVLENTSTSEPIIISDNSGPASPSSLKRSSSDPDVMSDPSPQAYKRPKKAPVPEKENIAPNQPVASSKENTSTFMSRLVSKANSVASSPFTNSPKLQSAAPHPPWMDSHMELMQLTFETLDSYRNKHNELLTHVMQLLFDGGPLADARVLGKIRRDIEERINAIQYVQARQRGKAHELATLPSTVTFIQPSHSQTPVPWTPPSQSASSSTLQSKPSASQPGPSSCTQPMVIDVDEELSPRKEDRRIETDSDDELWHSFEDIPDVDFDKVQKPSVVTPLPTRTPPTTPAIMPASGSQPSYMEEVQKQLRTVFGLTSFRPNQLEAISATLEGRDVFVLMPTGGGKSLCYQLPAVCTTGKTCGVTVVVSPLTALMEDQVSALTAKGVDAFFWSADSCQNEVYTKLFSGDRRPSLLYVTPEKLKASNACQGLLSRLYQRQELARFAIDEAHCISTWGQDFRSAYQGLGQLRQEYATVPIIALTATANQRTREDIVNQLQLRNHAFFTQSFNRPNLNYVIKPKKNTLEDIVDFIRREHPNSSGVIYCLSRKSCETLAGQLGQRGIRAEFFHAGLSKEIKNRHLENWKADKFRIIVATIAFGMGIDKPDVRFVIHHDLPKSLSGYYQETGRAGRDGRPSDCILYYSFKDFKTICWMIENNRDNEEPLTPEGIERQKDAALEVVKYCANISECRRVQVLRHFGQEFDKRKCNGGCDNCLDNRQLSEEDVTIVANNAIDIVRTVSEAKSNITIPQLTQFLRGSNGSKLRDKGLDDMIGYGTCKALSKELVELALDQLLTREVLGTYMHKQTSGYLTEYVELGKFATSFRQSKERLKVYWRPPPPKAPKAPKAKGKSRAVDVLEDDPIEPFPDEGPSFTSASLSRPSGQSSASCSGTSSTDSMTQLYNKLNDLRRQIMINEGLGNEASVMSENLLQTLCFTCPQDYLEFNRILDEADGEVTSYFNNKRNDFLQICVKHHLEGTTNKVSPPMNVGEMRSRFSFGS